MRLTVVVTACVAVSGGCAVTGRVLHVDNQETVPYTSEDLRLKRKIVGALVKHRLLAEEQRYSCLVNIMTIDRFYIVEVWPDGTATGHAFGAKLKKPFLVPVETYTDCR